MAAKHGIQSVEVAARILRAPGCGRPVLKKGFRIADNPARTAIWSAAHRTGAQDRCPGHYGIGPVDCAGLSGLRNVNVVRAATAVLLSCAMPLTRRCCCRSESARPAVFAAASSCPVSMNIRVG